MSDPHQPQIKSVTKAIAILQALRELEQAGVTRIANHCDLPKSTTHRYLSALEENDFVVNRGTNYSLSLRFLEYGEFVRNALPKSTLFKQKTKELANLTSERTQYIVEEHGKGVHLFAASGDHGIYADVNPGKQVPLHATAAGKSILAFKPREWVEELIEREGLPKYTENTITDKDELLAELDEVRETRISYNREERVEGLLSVGAPVVQNDVVYGAFSITGAKRRMEGSRVNEEIPETLLKLTEEVELKMKYSE